MKKLLRFLIVVICIFTSFSIVAAEGDSDAITTEYEDTTEETVYVDHIQYPERQDIKPPFEDEVDHRFYVKFVDTDGNVVKTGKFTDNKTCSNYFSGHEYFDGYLVSADALACAICMNLNSFETNYAYMITNNCRWAEDFLHEYKLAEPTGETEQSGYCTYPKYKLNMAQISKPYEP